MFFGGDLSIDHDGVGILGVEQSRTVGLFEQRLHVAETRGQFIRIDRVNSQPEMDVTRTPHLVPMFGGVETDVPKNGTACLHAQLKLRWKADQRIQRKFKSGKTAVGKGKVKGALRFFVP